MEKFSVPDMSCGHCVATIESAVKKLDPSAHVNADLDSKTVEIDSTAKENAILDALKAEGYPATLAI